jgi:Asp/Glu/hydantoin racemase
VATVLAAVREPADGEVVGTVEAVVTGAFGVSRGVLLQAASAAAAVRVMTSVLTMMSSGWWLKKCDDSASRVTR